jgi:hypothetical protein
MGLGLFGSSCRSKSCDDVVKNVSVTKNVNPNPKKFMISRIQSIGNFLIAEVFYSDCTNFEGRKILVFKDISRLQLESLKELDPHFCNTGHTSPVARFVPTKEGWEMAKALCITITKGLNV